MTRVYLIRHAEAEGNIFRRGHGHYNSYITAKGHRQIEALSERFKNEKIDALYSSDLRRTVVTAGAITKHHELQIVTDKRLRELYLGSWEDEAWGDLEHRDPENMWRFNNDPARWQAPGAETYTQLQDRMLEAVLDIAAECDGKTVACVSHGMAIRALLCKIKGIPSSDTGNIVHGDNTSVTLLEVQGDKINIIYMNDNSHLPPEISTFAKQSWWQAEDSVDDGNLWFESLNPNTEGELYCHFYGQSWLAVHGSLEGFRPQIYLSEAKAHYRENNQSVLKAVMRDKFVGLIDLDLLRGRDEGYGWISLICVEEKHRRRQLGVQLLGHAVALCRKLRMDEIRLNVAQENEGAIRFYEEYEFKTVGRTEGVFGPLLLMERDV